MKVALAEEMRAIDRRAIEEFGIPGVALMQSAGEALARAAAEMLVGGIVRGKKIAILCGHGNNGGDGFVAARLLANRGATVAILIDAGAETLQGDAATFFAALPLMGLPVRAVEESDPPRLASFDLILDCLLGTGATGAPMGATKTLIEAANAAAGGAGVPILSADIPSGVETNTGRTPGVAIQATRTITFALPKPGLLLLPGALHAGRTTVAPVGLPRELLEADHLLTDIVTNDWARKKLPVRTQSRDANKGSFGKLLVIAGSANMTGAALLTAMAALRSGCGYVTLALPESVVERAALFAPELILRGLPETPERMHGGRGAIEVALDMASRNDAVAIGPGMGVSGATSLFVQGLLPRVPIPVVMDADALNALEGFPEQLLGRNPLTTVLTPHPMEMSRLLGDDISNIQSDRRQAAKRAAQRSGAVVLLKGARTILARGDGRAAFNRQGSTTLATAGSGDVLTGIIGTLLAQDLDAWDAARAGAYLHAVAGDVAEEEIGTVGVTAGDIHERIPKAHRRVYESAATMGAADEL